MPTRTTGNSAAGAGVSSGAAGAVVAAGAGAAVGAVQAASSTRIMRTSVTDLAIVFSIVLD